MQDLVIITDQGRGIKGGRVLSLFFKINVIAITLDDG